MDLDVFTFEDYRTFLLAHAKVKREERPQWSLRSWARHLELKNISSLTKILNGSRNPGPDITAKMIRYFSFDETRAEYFRDLIRMEKLKDDVRLLSILKAQMQRDYTLRKS